MGAEAEETRVRDFTVQHQCGRTRGLVDRRGGSGEGASWKASQKRPQKDEEGMPIRHTDTLHLLLRLRHIRHYLTSASVCLLL